MRKDNRLWLKGRNESYGEVARGLRWSGLMLVPVVAAGTMIAQTGTAYADHGDFGVLSGTESSAEAESSVIL